ncbi:hypothetical protein [Actinomadura latina]|uniref:Uncharacterized protein n=1 Tax=Actinomadura latina TaxID=163603 RepID=A0A846YVT4_9ACTN|nr:hypothetical protein [Actinomadura latina]NKZ02193.1 hypothetical protein [Actinomadura latina]
MDETRHGRAAGRRRLLTENVGDAAGEPVPAFPVLVAGRSGRPGVRAGEPERIARV